MGRRRLRTAPKIARVRKSCVLRRNPRVMAVHHAENLVRSVRLSSLSGWAFARSFKPTGVQLRAPAPKAVKSFATFEESCGLRTDADNPAAMLNSRPLHPIIRRIQLARVRLPPTVASSGRPTMLETSRSWMKSRSAIGLGRMEPCLRLGGPDVARLRPYRHKPASVPIEVVRIHPLDFVG